MGNKRNIRLTHALTVPVGSHILYFHGDGEAYSQNALSFIAMGIQLKQNVLYIEEERRRADIRERLVRAYGEELVSQYVTMIDRDEFYRTHEDFCFHTVLRNLQEAIQPFLRQERDVRLWGHVHFKDQSDSKHRVQHYEREADLALDELGFLTVCAYDGTKVPAFVQNNLMKSHEYLMTDEALVLSNLYRQKRTNDVSFPTLSARAALESEMDLYKQKLDFVHVVSHEVRNPLTVIKAYAKLVRDNVADPRDRERLKSITDYVDLIDNEISHIINTEEMLSSEALWRRRLISPKELLEDVVRIMEIKARTQCVRLRAEVDLSGREMMLANATGYKLIVSNLISNAIKYSHENGDVRCIVRCENDRLSLAVEDDGIGMTPEQVRRLFRKYEKMNEERGGQGIGLFMVKKLVDHFEGTIDVTSAPDVGTRIVVTFPLSAQAVIGE